MKHIAAYLLLRVGGNIAPTAEDIKQVLGSVGIEADDNQLNKLISELHGKDIDELIKLGSEKLAVVQAGSQGPNTPTVNTTEEAVEAPPVVDEGSDTDDSGFEMNIFGDAEDDF